jgi:hypothetical protein
VRPYLKNTHHKIGLVEWLKLKALSSSPNTAKKKKKKPLMSGLQSTAEPSAASNLTLLFF